MRLVVPKNSENILESRQKRIDGYSYKLIGNHYGLDVAISDDMAVDENRMSLKIVFADGNKQDGVGDLLDVEGIKTHRHVLNPIVLFDHGKHIPYPIAMAEDPDSHIYTVKIDPISKTASLEAFFYQGKGIVGLDKDKEYNHAIFCEQLFDMTSKRFIRGGSIGYQIVQAKQLPPSYESGTPQGLHLLVTLMLEGSLVVLPANQDTVRKMLSFPKICGKPISPYFVKSLTPYAPPYKAQMGYERKCACGGKGKCQCDRLHGGIADEMDSNSFDKEQLKIGTLHEKEHTDDEEIAREIAMDHLAEDPDYYRKLEKMEGISNIRKKYKGNKKMKIGKKALPTEMTPETPPEQETMETPEEENVEKYGAQILRKIHYDHIHLMQEYDGLMDVLENEAVRTHLVKILEGMEDILTATEGIFAHEYSELEGLEGGMEGEEKDLEEGGEETGEEETEIKPEASSEEKPEVSEEEAVEGMQKNPRKKNLTKVKKKDMEQEQVPEEMEHEQQVTESQQGLERHHKKAIGEATTFLHELSGTRDFGDEHRMKSYHFHKALDFALVNNENSNEMGAKSLDSRIRDTVGRASHFFKELTTAKDFGDIHREYALMHAKALEPLAKEEVHKEEEQQHEEMGDVNMKSLFEVFSLQEKELELLNNRLSNIRI